MDVSLVDYSKKDERHKTLAKTLLHLKINSHESELFYLNLFTLITIVMNFVCVVATVILRRPFVVHFIK